MKLWHVKFRMEGTVTIKAEDAEEAQAKFEVLSKSHLIDVADPDLESDDPVEVIEDE
jgi:hypothetical protein